MSVAAKIDKAKVLEAIVFIATKVREPSYHSISKVLYFADKLHLSGYGRLITGDTYIAMENGPVPSWAYDVMKAVGGRREIRPADLRAARAAFSVEKHWLHPTREADAHYFSKSELECLEASIAEHGSKSFGELTDESHDAAWSSVEENAPIPLEAIASTLTNAEEVREHLAS
jgi:uncharacterized phage-associated protein